MLCCLAAAPATQPTTKPQFDATTPIGMLRLSDSLNGASPEVFARFYFAANDDLRRVVDCESRFDAQFGLLVLLVQQKWGGDAGDQITHALGGETTADILAADLKIDGDHATLTWKDENPPLPMIRIKGLWKVDLAALIHEYKASPDEYMLGFQRMSQVVSRVALDIDSGKLATLTQAVDQAKQRSDALNQP